jgi:hypothetical protein
MPQAGVISISCGLFAISRCARQAALWAHAGSVIEDSSCVTRAAKMGRMSLGHASARGSKFDY